MDGKRELPAKRKPPVVPGIVIRLGFEPPRRPTVAAFIWGGKVRPVPAIPFGRRSAA